MHGHKKLDFRRMSYMWGLALPAWFRSYPPLISASSSPMVRCLRAPPPSRLGLPKRFWIPPPRSDLKETCLELSWFFLQTRFWDPPPEYRPRSPPPPPRECEPPGSRSSWSEIQMSFFNGTNIGRIGNDSTPLNISNISQHPFHERWVLMEACYFDFFDSFQHVLFQNLARFSMFRYIPIQGFLRPPS